MGSLFSILVLVNNLLLAEGKGHAIINPIRTKIDLKNTKKLAKSNLKNYTSKLRALPKYSAKD